MTAAHLAAVVAGGGLAACLAVLLSPARLRAAVSGVLTAVLGGSGVALGVLVIGSGLAPVHLGWLIPLAGVTVAGDATSGLFVLVTGAVAVAVGVYSPGYFGHLENSRVPLATMPALCYGDAVAAPRSVRDDVPRAVGTDGPHLADARADRASPSRDPTGGPDLRGHDAARVPGHRAGAGGLRREHAHRAVRRHGSRRRHAAPGYPSGHLPAVVRGFRVEGRAAAAARLAGPRASRGAESGVSAAQRRHGQHGYLRGAARRRGTARSRAALVGSGPRPGRGGDRRLRGACRPRWRTTSSASWRFPPARTWV